MDFFNKAKEKLSKTGSDVAKKAKDLSEIAKFNSQISSNESTIKNTYSEIGKYVYENLKEDAPAEIAEKMAVIDNALAEIERLKQEILKVKGSQKCEQCGNEVDLNVAFCPSCGNKMPEPVVEVIDEEEVKEVVEEAAEAVEEAVEGVAEKVEDAVEAVAEKVEEVTE
ncbi:MAG: zinc-ribbon domain-containing protein [Lachnospiraceae bacterium]|nr:zinc-ribbon domain-containing protein [Lachnospiraceae bacterium]